MTHTVMGNRYLSEFSEQYSLFNVSYLFFICFFIGVIVIVFIQYEVIAQYVDRYDIVKYVARLLFNMFPGYCSICCQVNVQYFTR